VIKAANFWLNTIANVQSVLEKKLH